MKYTSIKAGIFAFLLFCGFSAHANDIIALHPLIQRGEVVNASRIFYSELFQALPTVPGSYIPYEVNPENIWASDIPTGGYPAYICPPNILTGNIPYAITGEISPDADFSGQYRLRLYLWDMELRRLIISDEITGHDEESIAEYMPEFLAWLFSRIVKEIPPPQMEPEIIIIREVEEVETEVPPEKWLYLGLRGGGGYSEWYHKPAADMMSTMANVILFYNANIALQGEVNLLSWLSLQTEANVNFDFNWLENTSLGAFKADGFFSSLSITVPLLFKINFQNERIRTGIFAGAYLYVPLYITEDDNFSYTPDIPGFIFGVNIGWKLGPGFVFIDGRFDYDGHWANYGKDIIHYRNVVKFTAGYMWGLINKKQKQKNLE